MQRLAVCLLVGACALQWLPDLPPTPRVWLVLLSALPMSLFRRLRLPAFVLTGFSIMALAADRGLADRLDPALQGETVVLSVRIVGFADADNGTLRFAARPLSAPALPRLLRISWFDTEARPAPGETWRLHLKLRRPEGLMNPGGFDYEGWLFREGIGATGYVTGDRHNYRLLGARPPWLDRIRAGVVDALSERLPEGRARAVMLAVAVGARHEIGREGWDLFAMTGTSHLMAISGLHIGLAAGCAFLLVRVLAAPVCRRRPVREAATVAAVSGAGAYALVSGLAVPAVRALSMTALGAAVLLARRRVNPLDLLATALVLLFAGRPLSLLTPGFRLSFAAVAVLIVATRVMIMTPSMPGGRWLAGGRRLILIQWYLLFALLPLTLAEFGRVSLSAPLVNLLVMPVFNLLTVPLTLLGLLIVAPLPAAGGAMLDVAHGSIEAVLRFLDAVAAVPLLSQRPAAAPTWITLLPLLWVFLPPGWPGRGLAIVALVTVLAGKPAAPAKGCAELTVLDAGQGLAVVVRTASHSLLYDTGPQFRSGGNIADLVISPYLDRIGVRTADLLIVSHADLDHAGGAVSLYRQRRARSILGGEAVESLPDRRCRAGDRWHWDGVDFRILHPRAEAPWTGNNASCVLELSAGDHRILLPGDIEAPVERLLAYRDAWRPVRVAVVPHHGSRTSSSDALVSAVAPDLAIVSAAWTNRWGFPKPDVVARWQASGARVLTTAGSGAVDVGVCRDGRLKVSGERARARRYWHDRRAE